MPEISYEEMLELVKVDLRENRRGKYVVYHGRQYYVKSSNGVIYFST